MWIKHSLKVKEGVCTRKRNSRSLRTHDKNADIPVPPRRRLVEDKMGAAPMALGIMMGIPPSPSGLG
jgi:hypothetical protein